MRPRVKKRVCVRAVCVCILFYVFYGIIWRLWYNPNLPVMASRTERSGLKAQGTHFTLDGEPFTILSGAIHYFRVVPEYWEDRLLKLKALGLNTVETYVLQKYTVKVVTGHMKHVRINIQMSFG